MLDPYSAAHLTEAQLRIEKALDAQYIYNAGGLQLPSFSILSVSAEPQPTE